MSQANTQRTYRCVYTLEELAQLTNSKLIGKSEKEVVSVNTLDKAEDTDVSFLANPRYLDAMKQSQAGVICIEPMDALPQGKNYLVCDNPSRTFQIIAELLLKEKTKKTFFEGIHPTAVIHETASLGKDVIIGPHVVIDANVIIGDNTTILSNVSIGPHTTIGSNCFFFQNVCIRESAVIGNRVVLQPGVVIGSCGFGFTTDKNGRHNKLTQLGNVVIEDDVEIGANTTIDRARFQSTIIRRGAQIDNLVQIAHNVQIGEDSVIVAQTGIAGSTKIGKRVYLGGQTGIVGHIELCDGTMIASKGGVSKSITQPGLYRGEPVQPIKKYSREKIFVRRLEKCYKTIEELQQQVADLKKEISCKEE